MTKAVNIAQVGSFDVENYGDLLFPDIFQMEINKRIVNAKTNLFSPNGGKKPFSEVNVHRVKDLSNLPPPLYNAILIGGGDLISLNEPLTADYNMEVPDIWMWIKPIQYALELSSKIIWNAPGVPKIFTEQEKNLIRKYLNVCDYISVRDEYSAKHLVDIGAYIEVSVVPDTVFLLDELFNKEGLHKRYAELCKTYNWNNSEEFILFQIAPYFAYCKEEVILNSLLKIKNATKKRIVLFPIGYTHKDQEFLERLCQMGKGQFELLKQKFNPFDMAAILASASLVIASSLHGTITAFCFGVPLVIMNPEKLSKLRGLAEIAGITDYYLEDLSELYNIALYSYNNLNTQRQAKHNSIKQQISRHFDTIAELLIKPKTPIIDQIEIKHLSTELDLLEAQMKIDAIKKQKDLEINHIKHMCHLNVYAKQQELVNLAQANLEKNLRIQELEMQVSQLKSDLQIERSRYFKINDYIRDKLKKD